MIYLYIFVFIIMIAFVYSCWVLVRPSDSGGIIEAPQQPDRELALCDQPDEVVLYDIERDEILVSAVHTETPATLSCMVPRHLDRWEFLGYL